MHVGRGELTEKEMRFAQHRAMGLSAAKSYLASGYAPTDMRQAATRGYTVEKRQRVKDYIQELKDLHKKNILLTMDEKRAALASIVRAKPSELDENSIAASVSIDGSGKRAISGPKTADKLKAIELDSRLSGELNDEQKNQVMINLVNERLEIPGLTLETEDVPALASESLNPAGESV